MTVLKNCWLRFVVVALLVSLCFAKASVAFAQDAKDAEHKAEAAAEAAMEDSPHGGSAGAGAAAAPNPLAVDPDLAIWTAVIFILLFAVLRTFAWPQISAALEERERKMEANIAEAQALNEAAKRLLAEHEAKLAATAGEVREMLDEARRDADSLRKRIEGEGHQAAKDELDRAVREIGRARDAAVQDLAVTSANVAIDLARNVVKTEISADRQQQIVREALSKLSAAAPSQN
jgi:F-type H+-transporting ATPase subunit b